MRVNSPRDHVDQAHGVIERRAPLWLDALGRVSDDVEMAEVGRQRQGEMVQGVLRLLRENPDGLQAAAVIAELEHRLPPTSFEDADYPKNPGVRRYPKIVRFATIPAVKAGWLLKTKGIWTITPEGEAALSKYADPVDLIRESVVRYQAWRRAQPDEGELDEIEGASDQAPATATSTLEEAEEGAWSEISRYLAEMPPYDFQDLVAVLLKAMGYFVSYVSPPGPDQGLDIIAFTDPLGAAGPRIKVQVKRRGDKIGAEGVRAFMALLAQQDVGLFVSTGGFTSEAEREVRSQEVRRIRLIGAEQLFDLWVTHYEEIPDQDRRRLPLRPVYFLAPEE